MSKAHDHVVIKLPATNKKWPLDSFPRGVTAVQFHDRSPSVTDNIEICQSNMTALSSRTSTYALVHGVLSYDNARGLSQGSILEIQCPVAKMP